MSSKIKFSFTSEARSLTNLFNSNESNSDNLIIEKENLLCVFKLVVKDLLNLSLKHERLIEKENFPLKHFFIVFEYILLHGYTGKKSFTISSSSNRKDLWPIIDIISRKSTDTNVSDIATSIKEMNNIRTPLGRVRAWLRLAFMQKHLADYFKLLIEQKQELKDLYENEAILLSDESTIIAGLLVGLNVLDLNLCLREAALDHPIEPLIHYSLYLRERRLISTSSKNSHPPGAIQEPIDELDDASMSSSPSSIRRTVSVNDDTSSDMNVENTETSDENKSDRRLSYILDQKNYIEELNRNLQKTIVNLQKTIQTLEQTNKSLDENNAQQKIRIVQLEEETTKLMSEREQIQSNCQKKLDTLMGDIEVERETYQKSRTGFDAMYNELQKKYDEECTSKQKIENAYQTQVSQNNEFLDSTKSMEKDIEEKKTLYDHLKHEYDQLVTKFECEKQQTEQYQIKIHILEKENQVLRETISELETNIEQINQQNHSFNSTNESLNHALAKLDAEKTSLETDLQVEKDFHQRLQKALNNEKEKVSTLQFDIHELTLIKQEYELYKTDMMRKHNDLQKKLLEQDETMEDLALKLQGYIEREDKRREKDGMKPAAITSWMKDENVRECCQCKKEFNALRRKHHCRNCGQIFCESCVSTKMVLPGSNKAVRVCDECCKHILAQCVVNNP